MNDDLATRTGLPSHAIGKLRSLFACWPAVESVVLYGSRAKGNFRPGSDIDITILGEGVALDDLLRIDTAIDDLLLPWTVDLSRRVDIENPDLLAHIDRVGIELYRRSPQ